MLVVTIFLAVVFSNVFRIPFLDKLTAMDTAISTMTQSISANYDHISDYEYMDKMLRKEYNGYFRRILFVDQNNKILYDSDKALIGIKYNQVTTLSRDSNNILSKDSFDVRQAEVLINNKVAGSLVFIPEIDLQEALTFLIYLPFIMIVVFLLTILAMIVLLSKILTDGILKPLKELNYAAEMISSGDLDYEMKYKKDD